MEVIYPSFLRPIFWEFDLQAMNSEVHKSFIIERVLEKGKFDSIRWLFKTYTLQDIKSVIESSLNISDNTRNFWKNYFTYACQTS